MASIFGKKNRTSASSSTHSQSSPGLVASVPYSQLASGPPPVAGPSASGSSSRGSDVAASRLVSAPSTNPTLTDDGTPVRVSASLSGTPTKGEGSRRSNASYATTTTTTTTDAGIGTGTGRSSSHEYQEMLRRATVDTNPHTPIYETMASTKSPTFSPYPSPHPVRTPATPATPGTPGTPSQEFGMRPYPYVAGSGSGYGYGYGYGKSPETSSIRSMSSVNSTYDPNNPMSDTGRYPKFETQSIPGLANGNGSYSGSGNKSTGMSTPTTQPTTSLPLPSPLPNRNGEYARPPDQEIEFWYQQILQKTDLDPSRSSYMMSSPNPSLSRSSVVTSSSLNVNVNTNANASSAARSAANLPMDSKWTIVQQYWKSREQQQHQQHQHQHHKHHETTPKALGRKMATTATAKSGKGSVEYFLSHALSRTLTPAILFSLEISLRTETLE